MFLEFLLVCLVHLSRLVETARERRTDDESWACVLCFCCCCCCSILSPSATVKELLPTHPRSDPSLGGWRRRGGPVPTCRRAAAPPKRCAACCRQASVAPYASSGRPLESLSQPRALVVVAAFLLLATCLCRLVARLLACLLGLGLVRTQHSCELANTDRPPAVAPLRA